MHAFGSVYSNAWNRVAARVASTDRYITENTDSVPSPSRRLIFHRLSGFRLFVYIMRVIDESCILPL